MHRNRRGSWWGRSAFFLIAFVCASLYYNFAGPTGADDVFAPSRRLTEVATDNATANATDTATANATDTATEEHFFGMGYPVKIGGGGMILYILGVFYMFAGIAIVCDEFFVPALDVLTEWTGVSDDVAGATFMAAGGSAPELFTSLIGTFKESSVGFGTIVGSAVFNVLFVIGMCAIFSKELLVLTWWPLARDSTYYAFSLLVLAIFFEDKEIQIWEALILLAMYLGYVMIMKNNQKLHEKIDSMIHAGVKVNPSDAPEGKTSRGVGGKNPFLNPRNFRAGVLSHLLQDKAFMDKMAKVMVSQMSGDLEKNFKEIDGDNSGFIEKAELTKLLEKLELPANKADVDMALKTMDTSADDKISFEEFSEWFTKAETKINNQIADAFKEIDTDNNGYIEKENLQELIKKLGHDENGTEYNVEEIWNEASAGEGGTPKDKLDRDDFRKWYEKSMLYNLHLTAVNENGSTDEGDDDSEPLDVSFPEGTWARINYIILAPLVWGLHLTVPDVRAEGKRKLFPLAFLGSIVWIGVYSFLMVEWATMIGDEVGIPDSVMGLTFLAAGTSIPDLLTSVIVARQGHGDMAVSSSIGSNIFDVLVGLPLPWFLYCCIDPKNKGNKVEVEAETLFLSIIILFLMLVAVITTIKLNKWRMTKSLGMTMFVLYFLFVVQDLLRYYVI